MNEKDKGGRVIMVTLDEFSGPPTIPWKNFYFPVPPHIKLENVHINEIAKGDYDEENIRRS